MKPGATIFVYHTGFLPAAIRFHMKLWRFVIGKKYTLPWNHVEKAVPISKANYQKYFPHAYKASDIDKIWIRAENNHYIGFYMVACSARTNGAEMTPLSVYLKNHPVHTWKDPIKDLCVEDVLKLEAYAMDICYLNHRKYEKVMFLKWIKRIQTLGGYNPKHTDDKQLYCFETVNEFDKLLCLASDRDGLVDIYQLWENQNFK